MRTILTLSSIGLTLALSGAVQATSANRTAFLERTASTNEQIQNYYRHKRYYRQDENRARDERSMTNRRNRDGAGTAQPGVRKPVLTPEPAVFRAPIVRERPQIA
jgi:hypothetical protein